MWRPSLTTRRAGAGTTTRRGGAVVVRASGKGFGKPKPKPEPEAPKDERVVLTPRGAVPPSLSKQQGSSPPPPPPPAYGDSTWADEVRRQEAYETERDAQPQAPPPAPATMPADQYKSIDENFIKVLGFFFVGIFVEGLLVAGSGFLPDSADKFIVNFVFPAFTPSVGVFLLISVFYGLFKTKVEPK